MEWKVWEDFCLGPHIMRSPDLILAHYTCVVVVYHSFGQRLIRQWWEASLSNVGLSNSLRTKAQRHFQRGQYLIRAETKVLPQKGFKQMESITYGVVSVLLREWYISVSINIGVLFWDYCYLYTLIFRYIFLRHFYVFMYIIFLFLYLYKHII